MNNIHIHIFSNGFGQFHHRIRKGYAPVLLLFSSYFWSVFISLYCEDICTQGVIMR